MFEKNGQLWSSNIGAYETRLCTLYNNGRPFVGACFMTIRQRAARDKIVHSYAFVDCYRPYLQKLNSSFVAVLDLLLFTAMPGGLNASLSRIFVICFNTVHGEKVTDKFAITICRDAPRTPRNAGDTERTDKQTDRQTCSSQYFAPLPYRAEIWPRSWTAMSVRVSPPRPPVNSADVSV